MRFFISVGILVCLLSVELRAGPVLEISEIDNGNFGRVAEGIAPPGRTKNFFVTNRGDEAAYNIYAILQYGGAATKVSATTKYFGLLAAATSYSTVNGIRYCGKSLTVGLAVGESCALRVFFKPAAFSSSAELALANNIIVKYRKWQQAAAITDIENFMTIAGIAVDPAMLTISPTTFNFQTKVVGSTGNEVTLTLANTGRHRITALDPTFQYATPFTLKIGDYPGKCGTTIEPVTNCQVIVVYLPVIGPKTVKLTFKHNDGRGIDPNVPNNTAKYISLSGTGVTAANLQLKSGSTTVSSPIVFASTFISKSLEKPFSIFNSGGYQATGISVAATGPFAVSFTCTTSLNSNTTSAANCIKVTFNPTERGPETGSLTLSYNNGVGPQTLNIALTGTGLKRAEISITDSSPLNFGEHVTDSAAAPIVHTLAFSNTGDTAAISTTFSITPSPSDFSNPNKTCGATLAAGASCTADAAFKPTAAGARSADLRISFSDVVGVASPAIFNLTGIGKLTPARLSLSPASPVSFSDTFIGQSSEKLFTLTKLGGTHPATEIRFSTTGPFAIEPNNCPTSITDETRTYPDCVTVKFNPTARDVASGNFELSYHDGAGPKTLNIALSGRGLQRATLSLTGSPEFGSHTIGADVSALVHTFALSNSGDVPASVAVPLLSTSSDFTVSDNGCTAPVAKGGSCTFAVSFAPIQRELRLAELTIGYSDSEGALEPITSILNGTGVSRARLVISNDGSNGFGDVVIGSTPNPTKTFTISNEGDLPARNLSGFIFVEPFSITNVTGGCVNDGTVAGLNQCTFTLTFAPGVRNEHSVPFRLIYENGVASVMTDQINITARAITPALLTLSDTEHDFGETLIGSATSPYRFTLTKSGDAAAAEITMTVESGPFTLTRACPESITDPTTNCRADVKYQPSSRGAHTKTITISYQNGARGIPPQTLSIAVKGTGRTPALLTISDSDPFDFGTVKVGQSSEPHAFRVTNEGEWLASSISVAVAQTPFLQTTDCSATLAIGSSCTVSVTFKPRGSLTYTGVVSLNYHNGLSSQVANRNYTGKGSCDVAFGDGGKVRLNFDNNWDSARAVAIREDGSIVAVGFATVPIGAADFAVSQILCNGTPDDQFGNHTPKDGKITTGVTPGTGYWWAEKLNAVAIQSNTGKIIAAGSDSNDKQYLARFQRNGLPDGSSSRFIGRFNGLVIQPDGKIVAVGLDSSVSHLVRRVVLARFTAEGLPDTSFGDAGTGEAKTGWTATRFGQNDNLTGASDETFSEGFAVALTSIENAEGGRDNKILVAGRSDSGTSTGPDFFVARFNDDGTLDTTFGDPSADPSVRKGYTLIDFAFRSGKDLAFTIAVQSDGKIIVGGNAGDGHAEYPRLGLARLLANGTLDNNADSGFGPTHSGKVVSFVPGRDLFRTGSLALQPDGKIVIAGTSENPYGGQRSFSVMQFNPDGSLDNDPSSGFGPTHIGAFDMHLSLRHVHSDEWANSLALQSDGKIVVVGYAETATAGDYDFVFIRLKPDGTLDAGP